MTTAASTGRARVRRIAAAALLLGASLASAAPKTVLFVGNSFTFGRVDPVMGCNAANVNDLTDNMWLANATNSNAYEPKPWGGVPGIFQRLTVQAGLDYTVAMSARNAATCSTPTRTAGTCAATSAARPGTRWCCRSRATRRCPSGRGSTRCPTTPASTST